MLTAVRDWWPTSKSGYIMPLISWGCIFLVGFLVLAHDVWKNYDLYKNGKVVNGTVTSISSYKEQRSHGRHSRRPAETVTVYTHTVEYDGFKTVLKLDERIAVKTRIPIYYSTSNPQRYLWQDHPFTGFRETITPSIVGLGISDLFVLALLAVLAVGYCRAAPEAVRQPEP